MKKKVEDGKFKIITEMLREDNTLSALEIQKELIDKWVNVSISKIRKALKMRKYRYQNTNIDTMILTSNQAKARKI